jgi:hypothetical protein
MNYSFKICIPFWVDIADVKASTRVRNVAFIKEEVEGLVTYLQQRGVNITSEVYDFSPEPVISGATHKSFPLREFRKSEKWNFILKQTHSDYFIGLDSDMFIHPVDYEVFHQLLQVTDNKQIFVFNTKCVRDEDVNKVDWVGHNTNNLLELNLHYYCSYGGTGSFGGLWICPTHLIKQAGGFNENLKYRGHEDGDLYTRITNSQHESMQHSLNRIINLVPIHLPHVYHFYDPLYQSPNSFEGDWEPRNDWD